MGFWSPFKSICSGIREAACTVGRGIKNVVSSVGLGVKYVGESIYEKAKDIGEGVKKVGANLWNKFSGKEYYLRAERLYEEISTMYNSKRRDYDEEVQSLTKKIEKHIENINRCKNRIKTELFIEMAKKVQHIKDVEVSKEFLLEEYLNKGLEVDGVRTKTDLYTIDFNKNKFITSCQAIFTLGFYTRKKAKETLLAVKEEEEKIKCEISKMDAKLIQIRGVEQSLGNVEHYFITLIEIYENLLVRLDCAVNYLLLRSIAFAYKVVHKQMSIRRLPLMQQKEVEAIITASQILKVMTETQIMSVEDKDQVKEYSINMEKQFTEINKLYNAA